jgi:mRNA deadenylase 3'-5' endonuclease subunit Ccr4
VDLQSNGSYQTRGNDFLFTVMSYNVLSDKLAKQHPELYIGIKDQSLQQ